MGVLEDVQILCAFGEPQPGLPVPFEEHDFRDLEHVELLRAEKFHSLWIFIIAVRARHGICSTFILHQVGFVTCGACSSGQ